MRLIDHLRGLGMSNAGARQALQTGKVWLRDAPTADPGREIEATDVRVRANAPRIRVGTDVALVFRDDHLAVVIKPSGLLSVPARGRRGERTLLSAATRMLGPVLPVHRLDEGTSGLMLVARTEAAQAALKDLFFRHDVERRYLAIVQGSFRDQHRVISNRLVRDRGDGLRGSGDGPEASPATTELRALERLGEHHSLVEARLETGRTHQVRIHLAELGHPVLGDRIYGARTGRTTGRLALHAYRLGFRHPLTGDRHDYEAPLADELERLRRDLAAPRSAPRRRAPGTKRPGKKQPGTKRPGKKRPGKKRRT